MLNVIIPTFNSASYLEGIYQRNPFMNDDRVKVWILDNASTDKTQVICSDLTKKHPNVKCLRFEEHVCAGDSVIRGLELDMPGYRWIFGDRYTFNGNIDELYSWLDSSHKSEILVMSPSYKIGMGKFDDQFETIASLVNSEAAILAISCLSTAIYPPGFKIKDYNNKIYILSSFPHSALILASISVGYRLAYTDRITVNALRGEKNWAYRSGWFETGVVGWVDMLDRVSDETGQKFPRETYTLFTRLTSLGRLGGIVQRKLNGVLTRAELCQNISYFTRGMSSVALCKIFFVYMTPKSFIKFALPLLGLNKKM